MYMGLQKYGNEVNVVMDGVLSHMDATMLKRVMKLLEDDRYDAFYLDLKELHYIDDAGIGLLTMLRLKALNNMKRITILNVGGDVKDMFERTGLDTLFEIQPLASDAA